jgi:hypothetical protein
VSTSEPVGVAAVAMAMIAIPSAKGDYVLVCKLDMSTATDNPFGVVCMAGYVGLLTAWLEFEQTARLIFDRYGVTVLHAKEFYDTDGEFDGWSRDKKEAFIREIQRKCIVGHLDAGIIFGTPKTEWLKAKRKHNLEHRQSAFGFCFKAIINQIFADVVIGKAIALGETLSFVLESGDNNAGDAERIFEEAKAFSDWNRRKLYSFGFASKESAIGLQIADFLAVTSRKHIDKYSDERGYAEETAIASILQERIYLIDQVAVSFFPTNPRKSS